MKRLTRRLPLSLVAIFFLSFLFFSNFTFAQENPYWQKAGKLIRSGDFNTAIKEIDRLLIEMPDDVLLLRIKGVCFLKLRKIDQAEKILRKAVLIEPLNVAVNFYLANALTGQGNISEAIEILSSIKESAPQSPYGQTAKKLLPQLRSLETNLRPLDQKKRWNLYLGLSNEYDSNVPARSRQQKNTVTDSFRTISSGVFAYRFIDQNIDDNNFTLGARHSLYYNWHQKRKFSPYDLGVNSSDLFLAQHGIFSGLPYKLKLEGNYTNTRLGKKHHSHASGVQSSLSIQWQEKAILTPRYSITWENFNYPGAEPEKYSLNGKTHYCGLDHYLRMFNGQLIWGLGYEYRIADTKGSQFKMNAYNLFTSFSLALPQGISLTNRLDYTNSDYTKYEPIPKRLDKVIRASTNFTYPLSEDNLFLTLGYTYLKSNSKADFASYRRNSFRISFDFYH